MQTPRLGYSGTPAAKAENFKQVFHKNSPFVFSVYNISLYRLNYLIFTLKIFSVKLFLLPYYQIRKILMAIFLTPYGYIFYPMCLFF